MILVPTLLLMSILCFFAIELPPGDFADTIRAQIASQGDLMSPELVEALRQRYGLDDPLHVRYVRWMINFIQGDFGWSFEWSRPVSDVIGDKLLTTVIISSVAIFLSIIIAVPVGVMVAWRRRSLIDYSLSFVNFIGLATPDFLVCIIVLWLLYSWFGVSEMSLFSETYENAPWSLAKALDLMEHMWIPVFIIALNHTSSIIRVIRANLLDEMRKPYVLTAKAKGLSEWRVLIRYPLRVALVPVVATLGWSLPQIFSGATIVAVVLNLPTTGPILLRALMSQDMYLAGSLVFLLGISTVVGTILSDVLLRMVDPRIRVRT